MSSSATTDYGQQIYLAAFGKHPGWNDHIDDIGLETDALVAIKRLLYTDGIGPNIDAGAWEGLDDSRRLEAFNHAFAWRTRTDVIVGRLWSSRDGKGRSKYPMVVCAHCAGVRLDWTVKHVLPRLANLQEQCVQAATAQAVIDAISVERAALRAMLSAAGDAAAGTGSAINPVQDLLKCSRQDALGPDQQGLMRIIYQVEREMWGFKSAAHSSTSMRSRGGSAATSRAQQMRVPRCAATVEDAAVLWIAFLLTQLHESTPMLALLPLDQPWVDLAVGDVGAPQLVCLRTALSETPLATEIPYTFEPDFKLRAEQWIADAAATKYIAFSAPQARQVPQRETRLLQRLVSVLPRFHPALAFLASGWALASGGVVLVGLAAVVVVASGVLRGSSDGSAPPSNSPAQPLNVAAGEAGQDQVSSAAQADWRRLCAEHCAWFDAFRQQMNDPQQRQILGSDEHLSSRVVGPLNLANAGAGEAIELSPVALAAPMQAPLDSLARRAVDAELHGRLLKALEVIDQVRAGLASWPARQATVRCAASLERLGFSDIAAELQELARSSEPPDLPPLLAASRDRALVTACEKIERLHVAASSAAIVQQAQLIARLDQEATGLQASLKAIAAEADSPLPDAQGAILRLVRADTAQVTGPLGDQLEAISRRIAEHRQLADELVQAQEHWSAKVDHDWFAQHAPDSIANIGSADPPSSAALQRWAQQVRSGAFDRPEPAADPRAGYPAMDRLSEIDRQIALLGTLEPLGQLGGEIQQRRAALNGAQVEAVWTLPWDRKHHESVTAQAPQVIAALDGLHALVQQASQRAGTNEEARQAYLARVKSEQTISRTGSSTIDQAWRSGRDRALSQPGNPAPRLEPLRETLLNLEQRFPRVLELAQPASRLDAAPLQEALLRKREAFLAEAVNELAGSGGTPNASAQARYSAWLDGAQRIVAACAAVQQRLAELASADDPVQGRSLGDILDEVRAEPALADLAEALSGSLEPGFKVQRLATAGADQMAVLADSASAGPPAERWAAWRRLGQLGWPSDMAQLAAEARVRPSLREAVRQVGDPARRAALETELLEQGQLRWARGLAHLSVPVDIDQALELRAAMDVSPERSDAPTGFVVLVHEFNRELSSAQGGPGAEESMNESLAQFRVRAASLIARGLSPRASALLKDIDEAAARPGAGDPSAAGPAAVGWKCQPRPGSDAVAFTWQDHTLAFRPISSGQEPAYLCETELPLGVLMDWVHHIGAVPAIVAMLPGSRDGALGWRAQDGGLVRTPWWSKEDRGAADNIPADEHPLQHVSPELAAAIVRMFNCRFPTETEWRSALERERGERALETYLRDVRANVRDATWSASWTVAQQRLQEGAVPGPWPCAGVFWPQTIRQDNALRTARGATAPMSDYDDGFRWFAPVSSPSGQGQTAAFSHLIGNVAEFVFDAPQVLEAVNADAAQALAAAPGAVRKTWGKLGVIGGSALSDPAIDRVHKQPLFKAAGHVGFCDVGIRLAFTARPGAVQADLLGRLREVLSTHMPGLTIGNLTATGN